MTATGPAATPVGRPWRTLTGRARLLRARAQLPPVAVDATLVTALFVLTAFAVRIDLHDRPWLLVIQAALLLPLMWRRRAPLTVFAAVAVAAFAQWLVDVQLPADIALLIALYTVAAHAGRPLLLLAGAVSEAGVLMASVRWSTEGRFLGAAVSLTAMATAAAVIGTNMRTRRAYLASVEDRAVRLERERDQRAQLAVAEERARIARDMHDIVSHNLSVMIALADAAVFAQYRTPDRTTTAMRQVADSGRQSLTEMRRFLGILRADEPDALRHPIPGIAQLQSLLDQVRTAGLPTRLRLAGDPSHVPTAAQLTVYRLVQEALTNTLKHAPPGTRAEVRVRCSAGTIAIDVTDDGHGRAALDPDPPRGHGIPGMRERTAAYGGTLRAGPLPGGGWRVSAHLDLSTAGTTGTVEIAGAAGTARTGAA
ncbi:sensor histidine kinase [Streptomyces sp. NBC_01433]|uniref:sensor histidine kinase n=1 Tax=Streptomyces sp. NBC_01433 TaxID=2903864 RepID=UPI002253A1ED|nr:sensor histidine kinase [Streptomyces sp. NBC_01433]MCX4679231.1 sensor histidine kinase [Streptomyces sp. NBC_01433]